MDLNSQILEAINSAVAEKVIPSIQNTPNIRYKRRYKAPKMQWATQEHRSRKQENLGKLPWDEHEIM